MSQLEFISFLSSDLIELPGLLYTPKAGTDRVAVWLHGMGDNAVFYKPEAINTLAEKLADKGIALLAFNNRGAHYKKSLKLVDESLPEEDRQYQGGMYYELIANCVKDIDGAVAFLKDRGFRTFNLVGLSTGANKICAYHTRAKNNPFKKYVLAGPGDDTGLMFTGLGEKKFWAALRYAAKFVDLEPYKVMPRYTGMYPFSTQSARDILDPDGAYNTFPFYEATHQRLGKKQLFEEYRQIDRPTLIIYGENDEYTEYAGGTAQTINIFMDHTSNAMLKKIDCVTVPGADHAFSDHQAEFAKKVSDWLAYD